MTPAGFGLFTPPIPLPLASPRPFFPDTAAAATHLPPSAGDCSSPCYLSTAEYSATVSTAAAAATTHLLPGEGKQSSLYYPPYPAESPAAESSAMVSSTAAAAATTHLLPRVGEHPSLYYPPYPVESPAAEPSTVVSSPATAAATAHLPSRVGEHSSFSYYHPCPRESSAAESSAAVSAVTTTHLPSSSGEHSRLYDYYYYPYLTQSSTVESSSMVASTLETSAMGSASTSSCSPLKKRRWDLNQTPLEPEEVADGAVEGGGGGWAVEETEQKAAEAASLLLPPPPLPGNSQFYHHPDRTGMYSHKLGYDYAQGYLQGPGRGYGEPSQMPFEDRPSYCGYGYGCDWGTEEVVGIDGEKQLFGGGFYGGSDRYCCGHITIREKVGCGKEEEEEEKEEQSSRHMDAISELKLRDEASNHTLLPGCAFNCSPILGDGTIYGEAGQKTLKEPTNTVVGGNARKSEDIVPDNIILPDSITVPESATVPEKICLAKEEHELPSAFHLPASRHEMLAMSICNLSQVLAEKQAAGLSNETEVKYLESTICNLSYCLLELTKKGESTRTKQGVKNQVITDSMDTEANSDLIDMRKVFDVNDKDSIGSCPSVPSCKKDHAIKLSKEQKLKKVAMQDVGRLHEEIAKLKTSFSELKDRNLYEASENSAISDIYKKLWMDTEGSLASLRSEMMEAKQSIKDLKQTFMLNMHKSATGYQGSVEASEDSLHRSTCLHEGCEYEECNAATEIEGGEGGSDGEDLRGMVGLETSNYEGDFVWGGGGDGDGGEGRTRWGGGDGSVVEKEKPFLDTDGVLSRFALLRARSISPNDDSTMGDIIAVSGKEVEKDWVNVSCDV